MGQAYEWHASIGLLSGHVELLSELEIFALVCDTNRLAASFLITWAKESG